MKSMRLSELKKKSDRWFRRLGPIKYSRRMTINQLRYMARRSFEALPKDLKKYLADEKERIIETTAHAVKVDGPAGQWDMYRSMLERAKDAYKTSGDMTADFIYRQFRLQTPTLFAKYSSYVYRLGHSASEWFKTHFEYYQYQQYYLQATIELPVKTKGVTYNRLEITFRFSEYNVGNIEFAEMVK